MLVRDVVKQNPQAAFANDVQLAWYPSHERNLPLVRGYMFTNKAIEGYVPSIELLNKFRYSFWNSPQNRYVVIATYGHGKSHFALSLANFFGKPACSDEMTALLVNIEHASDSDVASGFRAFKEGRPPFLVVRLRGDQPQSLHQQFLVGLQTAIDEQEATKGTQLPFWFGPAATFLDALSPEARGRANTFLANRNMDVPLLLERVRNSDQTVYDLCIQVHRSLIGTIPDFGGEISLQNAVEWAADTFCTGETPRAGGILILFDEFSAFIQRYAERREMGGSASLQDLLNGVENRQRKVVFIAFSQHDPDTVAENAYRFGPGGHVDDLKKELERLPHSQRFNLFSSLETVLAAYLQQDAEHWETLRDQAATAFADASDDAMSLLAPRYDDRLGWGLQRFEDVVTRGCFPLHPLTTGLLASVDLKQVINSRSVLDFVITELSRREGEAAIQHGAPTWIYATALVDWFREMLADREYQEYLDAVRMVGAEAPEVKQAVLKAILLFMVGRLKPGSISFESAVSHLCGHSLEKCRGALDEMRRAGHIRFDESRKVYTFWPAGAGSAKLEELVRKDLAGKRVDWSLLTDINRDWSGSRLEQIEVEGVTWGSRQDWACSEVLLTRPLFTEDYLKRVAPLFRLEERGLLDGNRGCLIRLVAETDEDVAYFRDNAEGVLDRALPSHPAPVILAVPIEACPYLNTHILREIILKNWGPDRRREIGHDVYSDGVSRAEKDVDEDLKRLRIYAEYVVPQPFRATIQAIGAKDDLRLVLKECYTLAYRGGPRTFFTQYSLTTTNLRKAVQLLSELLAKNSVAGNDVAVRANKVADELRSKYLRPGSNSWGLLTMTDEICLPTSSAIRKAWDFLDRVFAPDKGSVAVHRGILPLLNPPCGYDYNQLALLFCAWFGYNRHDLELSYKGSPKRIEDYLPALEHPQGFIKRLCHIEPAHIARRDRVAAEQEIRILLQRLETEIFSRDTAQTAMAQLLTYAEDTRNEAGLRSKVSALARKVKSDLETAEAYVTAVEEIQAALASATTIDKLLTLPERIETLPSLGSIDEGWATPSDLRAKVMPAIAKIAEQHCVRLQSLSDIGDFSEKKGQLEQLRKRLERLGQMEVVARVDAAITALQASKNALEARQKDAEILAQIGAMRESDALETLRSNVDRLESLKPHADSTKSKIESKRACLARAIEQEEAFAIGLSARADKVRDVREARNLRESIIKRIDRFQGTQEQEYLKATAQRCEMLEEYYQNLQQLEQAEIVAPESERAFADRCSELLADYGSHLSDAQNQLIETAREGLAKRTAAKRTAATRWLDEQERQANDAGDPAKLLTVLSNPPPFLPADHIGRLEVLRNTLSERLRELQDAAAEKEKDAPLVAEVGQMRDSDPLSVLRANVQRLAALQPRLDETRDTIQRKTTVLQAAISRSEVWAEGLAGRLDRVSSLDTLRQFQTEIHRAYERYRGTPDQELLDAADERATNLEPYLRKVANLKSAAPQSPGEADTVRAQLTSLLSDIGEHLSAEQRALADQVQVVLEGHIKKKQDEAAQWLTAREEKAAKADPGLLLRELASPPEFLTKDRKRQLMSLRDSLQARIDEDEVQQVASRFGRIKDRQKRKKCIEELIRIDEELGG